VGLSGTVSHTAVWRCDRCSRHEVVCASENMVDQNPLNKYAKIWIVKPEDWMILAFDGSVLCNECWDETYFASYTEW
jgi:hypothetical protein